MAGQLFGTDGIRGKANVFPMTPEVALRTGRAVARVLKASGARHRVVIGRDTRSSGTMLESALASGLMSEGAEVLLVGVAPTPAVAQLTIQLGCDAGVVLTASHNPYEDNGIKIFGPDGYKLDDEAEAAVEELILGDALAESEGEVGAVGEVVDVSAELARYVAFARDTVSADALSGVKLVLDCANGAASAVGPQIFQALGAEVIALSTSPDGKNINEGCGALHPELAAAAVRENGAAAGICFDGDADRLIVVDGEGNVVSGDKVLCLCAKALHKEGKLRGDTLVATVMSNLGLRDALAADGIALETTGVGDRLVLERMREKGFSLGGENSGHIIFADHATTGDGIVSALRVLSVMKAEGKALAELANCMTEYPAELVALPVADKPPLESVPEIQAAIKLAESAFGDKGRTLVRYSGTEKKIRILVECEEAELAKEQVEAISEAVRASIGA